MRFDVRFFMSVAHAFVMHACRISVRPVGALRWLYRNEQVVIVFYSVFVLICPSENNETIMFV